MKYAIIGNNKTEAFKGAKGICPSCNSELIAKCGEFKIKHWAHKGIRNCDPWWESETEWHRSWKNYFPVECQENVLFDEQTNEKHIADVRTIHGLVIEFQHSHINPLERIARETFYKNMVWIVDGTRLKNDYPRFIKTKSNFRHTNKKGIFFVSFPHECFPSAWLGSSVPVIFDFQGIESTKTNDVKNLYCLFPTQIGTSSVVAEIPRKAFINSTVNGEWLVRSNKFKEDLIQLNEDIQSEQKRLQQLQVNLLFQRLGVNPYQRR